MPLFSHRLEPYTGKYLVGTHDLEVKLSKPEIFGTADLLRTLKPALLMETILCTLYYPAKEPTSKKHMNWLERPLSSSIAGYSRFLNKSKYLIGPALYILASGTQVPAFVDAELADKQLDDKDKIGKGSNEVIEGSKGVAVGSSVTSSTSELGTLVEEDSSNQFPLIVFSHGLGGNRTTYTQYCGELASRGYIVAVLEHRDGTGPITIVKNSDGTTSRIIDYIKPDTDLFFKPPLPILSSIDFRKEQLTMRTAEISQVSNILKGIQNGEGGKIEDENLRRVKGVKFDLGSWKNRIDMVKEVTMAGHSFGGATTLQVLRAGKTYPFVRGITLDPWIDPIPPIPSSSSSSKTSSAKPAATSSEKLGTDIEVPLLIINSEAFTLWSTHYGEVKRIVEGVKEDAKSWLMTLVGSIHLSFSDFPLIQPFIASRAGSRVDSKLAMSLFVEASHEFLTGDNNGTILGERVIPGDEKGTRDGEGYKQRGGKPMEKVGEVRMHVRPE